MCTRVKCVRPLKFREDPVASVCYLQEPCRIPEEENAGFGEVLRTTPYISRDNYDDGTRPTAHGLPAATVPHGFRFVMAMLFFAVKLREDR